MVRESCYINNKVKFWFTCICIALLILSLIFVPNETLDENEKPKNCAQIEKKERLFPIFNRSEELFILKVDKRTKYSQKLFLSSLQGLINRQRAEVYIDFNDELEQKESILNFIIKKYSLKYQVIDENFLLAKYSSLFKGIVVYDDLEEINIATTYCAVYDYLLADKDKAKELKEKTGLNITYISFDGNPPAKSRAEIYSLAFEKIYPLCNKKIIASLDPKRLGARDYAIATKAFTFYLKTGPFANKEEIETFERILEKTERDIPLIGWFDLPTGAEEMYNVKETSRYGKIAVGGINSPNLSFLTAYNSSYSYTQVKKEINADPVVIEKKHTLQL